MSNFNAYALQARLSTADAVEAQPLSAQFPGLKTSADEITGRPTMVRVPEGVRVPSTAAITPEAAALYYLKGYADAYGLSDDAVATAVVANVLHQGDASAGTYVVQLRQRVAGAAVQNVRMSMIMTADLELVAVSGNLSPFAVPSLDRAECKVGVTDAVARAVRTLAATEVPVTRVGQRSSGEQYFRQAPTFVAGGVTVAGDVMAVPVWFAMAEGIECAWLVDAELRDAEAAFTSAFVHTISGLDGRMLFNQRMSSSDSYTYTVWAEEDAPYRPLGGPQADSLPHPTGVPDGFEPPFIPPVVVQAGGFNTNPEGGSDPWLPEDATFTSGNNVFAYADHDSLPDGTNDGFTAGDVLAELTAPQAFNYIYDPELAPDANDTQVKAAVAQLFFVTNWLHNYWYDSGFDESAGNAQANNFGRGGLDGDAMLAEGQDTKGRNLNNANMSTRTDGVPPRMQMFMFNGVLVPEGEDKLTVSTPETLAGEFAAVGADFGPNEPTVVTGTLGAALDSGGGGTDTDACEPLVNDLTGLIALVDRGTCSFVIKTRNAQDAGAIGVVVASDDRPLPARLGGGDDSIVIPTIGISNADGATIRAELESGSTVEVELSASAVIETTVRRDGTIDNMISAHEWGHYLHLRLVDCGGTTACRGMSEGWSDFTALHLLIGEDDDLSGTYGMSTYATKTLKPDEYVYFGIRRYPYSRDVERNPLTFRHIQNDEPLPEGPPVRPGNPNFQVHNAGSVWASALWESFTALLADATGPDSRYSFEDARRRMADYIVAGMMGAPSAPTHTEQRDAILAAAFARDRRDHAILSAAFARRGMGAGAVSPPRFTTDGNGVTESYTVTGELAVAGASLDVDGQFDCDRDGTVDPGEEAFVHIEVMNSGMTAITETTVRLSSPSPNVSFPGGNELYVGAMNPFETESVTMRLRVEDTAEVAEVIRVVITLADPSATPPERDAGELVFVANIDDAAEGTTFDTVDASATAWTTADLIGADGSWSVELVETNRLWRAGSLGVRSDNVLESPTIEVGGTGAFAIAFDHAYDFQLFQDSFLLDGGVIEVSVDDGVTWQDVADYGIDPGYGGEMYFSPTDPNSSPLGARTALVGASPGFPALSRTSLEFGDQLDGASVKLRLRIGSSGYSLAPAEGWLVDNIEVIGAVNAPFIGVGGDDEVCVPVLADAGADQTARAGATVTLDGSASVDASGDPLVYQWQQIAGPDVALAGAVSVSPSFAAPDVASPTALEFSLAVTDGTFTSDPDTVVVTVTANATPVAGVGADQTARAGQTVTLIGFGFDPDGDPLSFEWSQTSGPAVVLSDPTSQLTTFVAPDVGDVTEVAFTLVVTDGAKSSAPVATTVTVTPNGAPVAVAGSDQAVRAGQTVVLEGAGSDPDGDALAFAWSQRGGPDVELTGATSATASFTAPAVGADTELVFVLIANDGSRASAPSAVTVAVRPNAAPTADAGADQSVRSGELVALDAGASADPDGDALTYLWTQTGGVAVSLTGSGSATASFTAPDVSSATTLSFDVIASDGVAGATASVTVTVEPNAAPAADAGDDVGARAGGIVVLDGSGSSDPDGDGLAFAWTQTAGPTVSLTGAASPGASFVAPLVAAPTTLEFRLDVSDGVVAASDVAVVTVAPNTPPTADAGQSQIVDGGTVVALDGSGSVDAEGDPLVYIWSQTSGPAVLLSGATTATPSFASPDVADVAVIELSLIVSDGIFVGGPATTTVTVVPPGTPMALAGDDQDAAGGDTVILAGGTNLPGEVDYQWRQLHGPEVELENAGAANATFVAPELSEDATLVFELTVQRDAMAATADTVAVHVAASLEPQDPSDPGDPGQSGGCQVARGFGSGPLTGALVLLGIVAVTRRRRRA